MPPPPLQGSGAVTPSITQQVPVHTYCCKRSAVTGRSLCRDAPICAGSFADPSAPSYYLQQASPGHTSAAAAYDNLPQPRTPHSPAAARPWSLVLQHRAQVRVDPISYLMSTQQ